VCLSNGLGKHECRAPDFVSFIRGPQLVQVPIFKVTSGEETTNRHQCRIWECCSDCSTKQASTNLGALHSEKYFFLPESSMTSAIKCKVD